MPFGQPLGLLTKSSLASGSPATDLSLLQRFISSGAGVEEPPPTRDANKASKAKLGPGGGSHLNPDPTHLATAVVGTETEEDLRGVETAEITVKGSEIAYR